MAALHSRRRLDFGNFGQAIFALAVGFAFVAYCGTTLADDLFPPPWRGEFRTTVAEWDFITASSGLPDGTLPAVVGDGGGDPFMTPGPGILWDPVFNGSWIGNTGGPMQFYIPNWIDNEPWKDFWIQITYQPNPQLLPPTVSNLVGDPSGPVQLVSAFDILIDPLNNLRHRTEVWRMFPNPDWETFDIFIGPDVVVTQVVLDTWSVPEPSTFGLAGIGLALLGIRTWRRRR